MQNNETFKQIMFWAAVIIGICAVVAGMIWLVSLQQKTPTTPNLVIENVIKADDWVKGNRDAKVVLIEYSDFQCPACAAYHPIVNNLLAKFGNEIAFVHRHFPLPNHANAEPMVYVAEAAGKQGKFFEMHAAIFEGQNEWSGLRDIEPVALKYAAQIGLNVEQFKTDMKSAELKTKIENTVKENRTLGITYTPSFFLNGKLISNPPGMEAFEKVISDAIEASK